jgi:hypothetical protein
VIRSLFFVLLVAFLHAGCEASAPEPASQPVYAIAAAGAETLHPIELRNPPSLGELDTGLHDVGERQALTVGQPQSGSILGIMAAFTT